MNMKKEQPTCKLTGDALAVLQTPKMARPMPVVSVEYQHRETGLVGHVDLQQVEWGFFEHNPRLQFVCNLVRQADAQSALAAQEAQNDKLRAELSTQAKALAAARSVIESQEVRIATLEAVRAQACEAVATLQSERDANAQLTGELAAMTAERDALLKAARKTVLALAHIVSHSKNGALYEDAYAELNAAIDKVKP